MPAEKKAPTGDPAEKTLPTVYEALSSVMSQVQAVKKGDRNTEQNYSFRGIDSVVNAVGPALRDNRVLVLPEVLEIAHRDVLTSRGKPSRECTVRVRYRFHGPAGDYLDVVSVGEAMDFGDKGAPKAMSVAFRVALLQALCIPTDEPDADTQTYERAPVRDEPPAAEVSPERRAKANELRDRALAATSKPEFSAIWTEGHEAHVLPLAVQNEHGDPEELGALVRRRGEPYAKTAAAGPAPEGETDA